MTAHSWILVVVAVFLLLFFSFSFYLQVSLFYFICRHELSVLDLIPDLHL